MLGRSTEMELDTTQRRTTLPAIWRPLSFVVMFTSIAAAHAATASPEQIEFFESKVRPIFVDHCYECHSAKSKSIKGGLQVDTRDGLLKGGDSGPIIVSGDPEKSLLIKAVRYTNPDLQMPPKNKRLSPEQIAALEAWIKMGAPDPRNAASTINSSPAAAKHWAFQPIQSPALPAVKNKRWAQNSIDTFVLAKLESAKLDPSPATDKRTVIRRATFDLTGLPPTPAETEAFLADKSLDAYSKLIDRLLASPRYGERWARHWLDVARYGDVKGYIGVGVERRYPYSYTYRDYVIRAFNEDLPYDRFILEQLAADQLALGEDKRPLAAMGFLTLGRRFINNQQEIIDDRIDVTTRGLMGLTVTCARCHDHKYDPIPTKDYYSLYGVFASSVEPTELPLIAKPSENASYQAFEKELKAREAVVSKFRTDRTAQITGGLRAPAKITEYLLAAHDAAKLDDGALRDLAKQRDLRPYFIERWRAFVRDTAKTPHAILGPWHAITSLRANDFTNKAAATLAPFTNTNAAPAKTVNPLVARAFATPPASLKEAAQRYGELLGKSAATQPSADKDEEALRQLLRAKGNPLDAPIADFDKFMGRDDRDKLVALQKKVEEWKINSPDAPARAHSLADAPTPTEPVVFIRGNAGNRGPHVPRQFPEIVAGLERKPFAKGSGRLELAQAIASTNNPLTARVIVNRVWLHHFGQGFVRTPSDFGVRADSPSHPELLDHLASRFMAEGWSLKKLHRNIMLSATYQQASEDRVDALQKDPNNLLLWKKNRHRLEFEAMRDSLLFVSGQLDQTMGGKPVELTKEPFPTRRAVYAYIDRQNLPGLFRTFDFANPDTHSPMRFSTTVPQQALFWMNSVFTTQQTKHLATRPELTSLPNDDAKVRWLYATLYQRTPTTDELTDARQFLQTASAAAPASASATGAASSAPSVLEQLVHVLLMANEFAFVD